MNRYWTAVLIPPIEASRFACGTGGAAPICVVWLFGVASLILGLFGGPTEGPGVSWPTMAVGMAMWVVASVWTLVSLYRGAACSNGTWQPPTRKDPEA